MWAPGCWRNARAIRFAQISARAGDASHACKPSEKHDQQAGSPFQPRCHRIQVHLGRNQDGGYDDG